ncbi:hypothetical protein DPMN_097329 [Dreissena polymorpha]|uniref:Uncharacterized protein n=1 Tax=Dreissena polymorpha TaxID=45954 RepID=A0A9D4LA40_DREPO|nr:hypothetical protein DPMN_097329 [Dreissena polymorpha]
MREKHKTATDESYRDLANLNEKLKRHAAFELELKANDERLNQVNKVTKCTTWPLIVIFVSLHLVYVLVLVFRGFRFASEQHNS